ncbi:MAG: efflux RND transporter periplasmic adaptor subunit [Mariprofundaceae bacterium]
MKITKMRKRMIWMLIAVGLLFGALFGYHMFGTYMMNKYLASNASPPATVTAMAAVYEEWQPMLHAIGSLRAVQGVNISAEVAGQVAGVHVHSGQQVKKGDLLVELNHRDDDAQLTALIADAKLSEISYKRDKAQLAARAISQATFDATSAKFVRSKAAVDQQKALIAKKRISAPFDGRIGIVAVNRGQYLNPADIIGSLQNTAALFVDFYLPQKDVGVLHVGQKFRLSSDAWPDRIFSGEISAVNVTVDVKTRNVRIEGRIDNPEARLFPGMFVSLAVDRGGKQRHLTLPQTAIAYNAYGATVFKAIAEKTAANSKAKAHLIAQQEFVTTGPTRGDQVAILSGVGEGDQIVTSGQMKLKNGTPLIIDNSIQPTNASAPAPQEH